VTLQARRDNEASSVAHRTHARHRFQEALVDPLSCHFHEPELGDVKHLGSSLVTRQGLAKRRGHRLAVALGLHVNEVNDDDSTNIAQTELSRNLFGGFEVVAEHGLFQVRRADVLAGVDVNDRERLGALE